MLHVLPILRHIVHSGADDEIVGHGLSFVWAVLQTHDSGEGGWTLYCGAGEWMCPGGCPGLQNRWSAAQSRRWWVRLPCTPDSPFDKPRMI